MTVSRPKKILVGTFFGIVAGIVDIVPMIFQGLTWDAILSALSLWAIAGFTISTSALRLNGALKGIVISFLLLIPSAIIVGWHQPSSLIPIGIMTLILGGTLGYVVTLFGNTQ